MANPFESVVKILRANDCATDADVANVLDLHQPQVSTYRHTPPVRQASWDKLLRLVWEEAYSQGKWDGHGESTEHVLRGVKESLSINTQAEIAKAFGTYQPVAQRWENNDTFPKWQSIRNLVSNASRIRFNTYCEMYPIEPQWVGGSCQLDRRIEWKSDLENCKGLYMFLDSAGNTTYVGLTTNCLFKEIEQRLTNAALPVTRYFHGLNKVHKTKNQIMQGDVARMLSVYEVFDEKAIPNLEAILIRVFANCHFNSDLEKLK